MSIGSPAATSVCATTGGTPCRDTAACSNRNTPGPKAPASSCAMASGGIGGVGCTGGNGARTGASRAGPSATWCNSPWWARVHACPAAGSRDPCRTARCSRCGPAATVRGSSARSRRPAVRRTPTPCAVRGLGPAGCSCRAARGRSATPGAASPAPTAGSTAARTRPARGTATRPDTPALRSAAPAGDSRRQAAAAPGRAAPGRHRAGRHGAGRHRTRRHRLRRSARRHTGAPNAPGAPGN